MGLKAALEKGAGVAVDLLGKAVQSIQAEFTKFYFAEIERWRDIVVRANVKVEK